VAKTASPLKIKKFLAPTPGGPQGDPVKTLTFAINRMGFAVADIGQLMVDDLAAAQGSLINAENDRKKQLEIDRKAEEQYEKDLDKKDIEDGAKQGIKKAPKKIGWIEALLKPLKWLAKAFLGWGVLTFLQQPGKRNDLRIGLAVIGGWFKTLYKVTTGSIGLILDGLGTKSPLMAVLKIVSGIGGLFLATRILRPWKLIGDYKRLEKYYKAFKYRKPGSKFAEGRRIVKQRQLNKQLRARKLLRMKRLAKVRSGRFLQRGGRFLKGPGVSKFMKVGGKFLKGGGMSVLAGAFSFGNRLASGKSMQNAVGGGAGAVIGGLALSALLTPILGPFGPIVGQLVGSFLGDKIGAFVGDAMTPLFKPIKRAFGMYFKIFKAYYSGIAEAFADLWNDGIAPLFARMQEIFKPLIDAGIQRITDTFNSPWAQEAMYNLVRLVNSGKRLMNKTLNALNIGTDEQKITREVENKQLDIADSLAKIKMLEKIQEEKGEDYKGPWFNKWRFSVSERIEKEKEYLAKLQSKESELIAEQTAQRNEEITGALPAVFPLKDGFLDKSAGTYTAGGLKEGMVIRPRNPESFPIDVFAIKAGKIRQYNYKPKGYMKAGMIIEGDGENPDINYRNVNPTVPHKTRVKPGDKIGELIDARKHINYANPLLGMMDSSMTFLVAQAYKNHKKEPKGKYNKNIIPLDSLYPEIFSSQEENDIVSNTVNPEEINNSDTVNANDLVNEKEYVVDDNSGEITIVQPVNQPVVITGNETIVAYTQNDATVY